MGQMLNSPKPDRADNLSCCSYAAMKNINSLFFQSNKMYVRVYYERNKMKLLYTKMIRAIFF